MSTAVMPTIRRVHPFEPHLGVAPFRCTGMSERRLPSGQPAGSCDHCGTGILYCFHIVSADGKRSIVGSDCVMRTGQVADGDGLTAEVRKLLLDAAREKRRLAAQRKYEKLLARVIVARQALADSPSLFSEKPHPFHEHAVKGLKLRDYFDYCLRVGGDFSRASACHAIETALKNGPNAPPRGEA